MLFRLVAAIERVRAHVHISWCSHSPKRYIQIHLILFNAHVHANKAYSIHSLYQMRHRAEKKNDDKHLQKINKTHFLCQKEVVFFEYIVCVCVCHSGFSFVSVFFPIEIYTKCSHKHVLLHFGEVFGYFICNAKIGRARFSRLIGWFSLRFVFFFLFNVNAKERAKEMTQKLMQCSFGALNFLYKFRFFFSFSTSMRESENKHETETKRNEQIRNLDYRNLNLI